MTTLKTKLIGLVAAGLVFAATVHADVKLGSDNFTASGYAAGSLQYDNPAHATPSLPSTDRLDIDAAYVLFTGSFKPVTGAIGLYYVPGGNFGKSGGDDFTVLDAYVTYDVGNGLSLTAGKFLSPLGYEAFHIAKQYQITRAYDDTHLFLVTIPAYHTGVKADYAEKQWGAGLALVDSVYNADVSRGDGSLKGNYGVEGYFTFTGVENLTLFAGGAYDSKNNLLAIHQKITIDLWASYQVTKDLLVAAEYVHLDGGNVLKNQKGYDWLTSADYTFNKQWSVLGRVSGEEVAGPSNDSLKWTLAPSYTVSDNLVVRAEVSLRNGYYNTTPASHGRNMFYGVQTVFKF